MTLDIRPVTADRWDDLVELFGPRGAVAGCWCMWWRLSAKEWEQKAYEGNRRSMRKLVDAGERPGLLAYRDGVPVGWVSVAPREEFSRIERSRVLGPIDDVDVVELNEAFAAQVIPVCREVGVDHFSDKLNPHGGAIALGHPYGMTGARIMNTLLNDLQTLDRTIGLETMCVGGGQGMAMLIERL
jgi:hypothetical protein